MNIPASARLWIVVALVAPCLAGAISPARAQSGERPGTARQQSRELHYDLITSVAIIAASAGVIAAVRGFELGPEECRWCERSDLNRVDRWFRDSLADIDDTAMDVTGGVATALIPLGAIGLDALAARRAVRGARAVGVDGLIMLESASVALALTTAVKAAAGRQRPYTLDLPEYEVGGDADQNASFFSGHTALGFSLAVSAGMTASLRGYRIAPAIWSTGLALATVAGFSRLAGDEHFFTDLVAGAAVGSAVGVLVPWQFHRPRQLSVSATQIGGGRGLAVQGWF